MFLRSFTRRTAMKLMGLGLVSTELSSLMSCSPQSSAAEKGARSGAIRYPECVPNTRRIFGRIEEICSWGVRRPAYPAGRRAEEYLLQEFTALRLENVRKEPARLPKWEPKEYTLRCITDDGKFEIDCFPLPHTAMDVDLELELALFEDEKPDAVDGLAALHPLRLMEIPATLLVEGGEELDAFRKTTPMPINPEGTIVDPRGSLADTRQILPFSGSFHDVMGPVQAAGALAFIGVLEGHPGDICDYYVPYDGLERPFPGVWIKGSDGRKLQDLLLQGTVIVQLTVKAIREMATGYNIVGELLGPDDEIILIGSHHDAPWASAVEDASGMALVLAQAEYWAGVPQQERPHAMQFVLQVGHMVGSAGAIAFVKEHRDMMDRVVLEVHLEHAANEVRAREGGLEPTGEPEPRWFFVSRNEDLQQSVINALLGENLDRSMILAPDVLGSAPTTDGGIYHTIGVPIVNYLTAPFYLFDPLDTPDKIHKPSLVGITRATIRILEDTRGVTATRMREGIKKT